MGLLLILIRDRPTMQSCRDQGEFPVNFHQAVSRPVDNRIEARLSELKPS